MAKNDPGSTSLQFDDSATFRRPLLHFISSREQRHIYLTQCVPLHRAAIRGDWNEAKKILDREPTLLNSAITKWWATILHVAVGANRLHFVEELLKLMRRDDLELQDLKGNTALCLAATVGNVAIAKILLEKNQVLINIRGPQGLTPLHLAVYGRKSDMSSYLFARTKAFLADFDWDQLFVGSIHSGLYDLALEMLDDQERLAFTRGDSGETVLHVLARKPTACGCQILWYPKHLLHLCMKDAPIIKLIKRVWDKILTLEESELFTIVREPYQLTSVAAEVGNFELLSVILSTYPDLIWELNDMGQSFIHVAVLHRHASIFNLMHEFETGPMKDTILSFVDDEGNNLLHCVAKLPPPDRLNIVSGAALQLMLELSWFEEVKKMMQPSLTETENSEGLTPRKMFTKEHEELLKNGEAWMKSTANHCMVVSTLIATGVFSAAFSLPGGNNDSTGSPNYLEKPIFRVFALSDSMALVTSSTSILIFLSILTSRYVEDDFRISLPLKLILGLVALFVSIISMMVAFSSAFFITYYHGSKWVPYFISVLACLPIPLFMCLQFSLWYDIVYSAYICSTLLRLSKRMIHRNE